MASKRCLNTLTRHCPSLFSSNTLLQNVIALSSCPQISVTDPLPLENPSTNLHCRRSSLQSFCSFQSTSIRNFSYQRRTPGKVGDEDDDDDDDEAEDEDEDEEGELSETSDGEYIDSDVSVTKPVVHRTYSVEEKEQEAAAIGYKVIGPLDPSERPFKPWEPVFAVVQIGSHQFKISNGDSIYTERLKFCEVNDKLILSKVLLVGSKSQTIIGRPILPDATVHAVVEEHALDAKVIIFKKKRRKNYRRTNGHRQELTRLRITKIEGVEIPEKEAIAEGVEIPEKEAIAA